MIRVLCFTYGVCNFAIGKNLLSKCADTLVGVNLLGGRKIRRNIENENNVSSIEKK